MARMMLSLWLLVCSAACAQLTPVPPPPTATPAHPFFIIKTWVIGGTGSGDFLTMDPASQELFIAHGPTVQVVNVETGALSGTVKGLREAHAIVLDEDGTYGYISDGPADMVRVFDRRTFQVVASIPTGPSPRSMALDPVSGLLFVLGGQASAEEAPAANTRRAGSQRAVPPRRSGGTPQLPRTESVVTVIDTQQKTQLAQILMAGALGFAQADGDGRIYITRADRPQIDRLDAQAVGSALHRAIDTSRKAPQAVSAKSTEQQPIRLDWTPEAGTAPPADALPTHFSLDSGCEQPRALAFDSTHQRLFTACTNYRMLVVNAGNGQTVAALPIGPGADAIGYDANRGLIYTANGAGDGSLTIIRQDVTDTYAVIQTLPTRQHARTLAINPSNGDVYLTSMVYGAAMTTPFTNGRPSAMQVAPVDSSFQVLVVGN